jgi:DNA-binding GntR family transcriptional regulator
MRSGNMRDSDTAYKKIKEMIITCQLKPGQTIIESELQEQIHVGRTPIREALNRLSWEKQICIIPRQCIMVNELSLKELESVYQMRYTLSILEGQLSAAKRSEEGLKRLRDITNSMENERKTEGRLILDREFHRSVTQMTENKFLIEQMDMLIDLSTRPFFLHREGITPIDNWGIKEYTDIIESIEERDEKRTIYLLQKHITTVKSYFLNYFGTCSF